MNPEIFKNLEFFTLLVPALMIVGLARLLGPKIYRAALLIISVAFIVILPGMTFGYIYVITAAILSVWLILKGMGDNKPAFWMLSAVWLLFFIAVKYSFWAHGAVLSELKATFNSSFMPIFGFAFLGVRIYSLIADVHAGKVKALPLLDYLIFVLWFPAFLTGPLERFSNFSANLDAGAGTRMTLRSWLDNAPRMVLGYFRVFVIAGLLHNHALPFLTDDQLVKIQYVYPGLIAYYFYEYMNFAGYTDIAIATSRIAGVNLPENFNKPYMATSLTDLWRRWHMTLAAWLRDYIYYPLLFTLMRVTKAERKAAKVQLAALAIFITFVICGLWHGETYGMLFFGISSGLVLAAETIIASRAPAKVNAYLKGHPRLTRAYPWILRFITLNVAAVTFGPVLLSNAQFRVMLGWIGGWL